jgi:hypothetical protein
MKYKKDNQQEFLFIEITAWALVIGIVYMFTKMVFGV